MKPATWKAPVDSFVQARAAQRAGVGETEVVRPAVSRSSRLGETLFTVWLVPEMGVEKFSGKLNRS